MELHKWYYPNLQAQDAKYAAQELVGRILGFPSNVLERKSVKIETGDMPEVGDLISMIADDGFPEWAGVFKFLPQDGGIHAAVTWTKLSYVREISESNYNTVLLSDNVYPLVHYKFLKRLLSVVPDDVYGVNLQYRKTVVAPESVATVGDYEILSNCVGTGFNYLFTPKGAAAFLDMWRQMPRAAGRSLIFEAYQKDPDTFPVEKWCAVKPMVACWSRLLIGPDTPLSGVDR